MNSHWNHVLLMLLCTEAMILSVNGNGQQQQRTSNCHILDRSGRRCSNGSGYGNQNGYIRNAHPHTSSTDDEESGNSHGHSSRHSSNERQSPSHGKKANNGTRMDSWPGHSLSANNSWSALSNLNNHNYELTTEMTTTESSDGIERFLVGRRRRKRSPLWMNPTLLYSRTVTHMAGNRNHGHNEEEEEEEESEEESNEHGHSGSESSRTSAVTRQIVHERTRGGSHGGHGEYSSGGTHGTSHTSGGGHGSNHSNRMPLFFVPRTNTARVQV